MIRNPKAILAILTALNLLNYLDRFVLSAVIRPLQAELQLSDFVGGLLATVFLIGYFATSPFFGSWADRGGPGTRKGLAVVGIVIWSLATLATGLARGEWSMLAARTVVGVGEASFVTIAPTILDDVAPPAKRSRWLAIFFTAIPVGSALGYLTGGAVQHATHDWRQAFFVAGAPGLVLAGLCALIVVPDVASERPAAAGLREAARRLLRLPFFRAVVLGQCAYTFAIGGFGFWAPKYIAGRFGMEDGHAAFVFGLVTVLGGAIGTLVGGAVGDRVTRGLEGDDPIARRSLHLTAVATALAVPLAAAAIGAGSANAFFALAFGCEIALFLPGGPYNVAVLRSAPIELRTSAMALSIFASHLFGDLWSPPLIGLVADHASMALGMFLCPAGFAVAALVWWRGIARP